MGRVVFCFWQVPSVSTKKIICNTVAASNGKLELHADETPDGKFGLHAGLFVPGPKHLLDNLSGDLLNKMKCFDAFQADLKIVTEAFSCNVSCFVCASFLILMFLFYRKS